MLELTPPALQSTLPAQYDLIDSTKWSYEYPSIVDGTLSPTTVTVTMSDALKPFIKSNTVGSSVILTYDGRAKIEALVSQSELFINLNLKDAQQKTSKDFRTQVIVTARPPDELDEKESVIRLLDPYLEPPLLPMYNFEASDTVLIELGLPVDPQGFEVKMEVLLGTA